MKLIRSLLLAALLLMLLARNAAPPAPEPSPTPTPTATATPTPTPSPIPSPSPTPPTSPIATPVPDADDADLDAPLAEPPPRPFDYVVVNSEPLRRVPNATRAFWVADGVTGERREVQARLRVQTEHVAMWIEEDVWHDVQQLEKAAIFFETQIYPTTRAAFGSEWMPGVDNDSHIHILHATGLSASVMGYTSAADEFPRALYPFSNEAEMIVVNLDHVKVGSPAYYALLVHQFQRLIQWFQDRNEERWVKEGLAELAVRLNGFTPGKLEQAYLEHPDTSLTAWGDGLAAPQRGAAYLFTTYFHERFDEGPRALAAQSLNGIAGFDATLAELGTDLTFEDLFADWLAANYLDLDEAPATDSGPARYGYAALDLERPAPAATYGAYPVTVKSSVRQFGADYIVLQGKDDLRIHFTGAITTPLLNVPPHSGRYFWWSNRADESLTTLTRAFDLSDTKRATLTYWTWYDTELDYDYATIEVSSDGGEQWQILSTPSGTDANPHGNNPGWGYTGQSDDPLGWIEEKVDLSPYAGSEVLIRFAYLTDEAHTGAGFVLDDIAIPEIGYADDIEAGKGGWKAAGFVRSDNSVPQRYLVLLIGLGTEPGDEADVERLPVQEEQTAEWTVPLGSAGRREAVLVLSGLAPSTAHPALYQLTIETTGE